MVETKEFESFNGPILMTTNCIVPPSESYKARVFITGASGFAGCTHIDKDENGNKDFSSIIEMAKKCDAPKQIEEGQIVGGFAHNQVLALAEPVVEAVKSGAIKKFFVMAGCAKYKYNKLNLGDINGSIPRVLDAGQCNDSYSLAVIALKLKEVFGLEDINELPIAYNIAWYEQKAVIVLLALLYLGVKNIHLGPTLPAFLSPNLIKEVKAMLEKKSESNEMLLKKTEEMLGKVTEMIFKEENIMIPMLVEQLTQDEWKAIADESAEIGFIIDHVPVWNSVSDQDEKKQKQKTGLEGELIKLPSGEFTVDELTCMLNTLPFDITFVNKDDEVKYFTEGKERIFPRTRTIIGRNVSNCHSPASVHIVEKIVEDFKSGKKDHEDFWIQMAGKYILIRYYAVRNDKGEYLGVLEVTQDIKPIQDITGEKRLLSE
jgi:hypothetical protein